MLVTLNGLPPISSDCRLKAMRSLGCFMWLATMPYRLRQPRMRTRLGLALTRSPMRVVGDGAELLEAELVALLRLGDETFVAGQVGRADAADLLAVGRGVVAVVEVRAVVEADAIERAHRHQRHVVGEAPAAQRPQLFQHEGRGDDGRAGVEGEAVLLPDTGAAAGLLELFQHRDAVALAAEPHRRGQAAEAAADDDGTWCARRRASVRRCLTVDRPARPG